MDSKPTNDTELMSIKATIEEMIGRPIGAIYSVPGDDGDLIMVHVGRRILSRGNLPQQVMDHPIQYQAMDFSNFEKPKV